ncbi:MAG: DUF6484 domain-containing protein [Desulfatitalea sp.]
MQPAPAQPLDSRAQDPRLEGVRIGKIVHVDNQGIVHVDFKDNANGPKPAKLSGGMQARLQNQGVSAFEQVLLLFEEGDPSRPVVIDVIVGAVAPKEEISFQMDANQEVTVDGKIITFDAQEQIVLRCGKASITLTRAGKIIIRGAYLLNRSSGVNRIKGGSVQIN